MKVLILFALFVFSSMNIFSEPVHSLRFHLKNGDIQEFNIDDIDSINIAENNSKNTMNIFSKYYMNLLFSANIIDLIKFSVDSASDNNLLINILTYPKYYPLSIIDSIKFQNENYELTTICNQTWMIRNLDVTHYRNGDSIPEVRDSLEWSKLKSGAWCYYNNDTSNGKIYGKLYNFYAIIDPRGLAPEGWHIHTDKEWIELETCLFKKQGKILKESGNSHWADPNNSTNEYGFSALPGGYRSCDGFFEAINTDCFLWSSSPVDSFSGTYRRIYNRYDDCYRESAWNGHGFSVRCVMDLPPKSPLPRINSIIPYSVFIGESIKISGSGFDTSSSAGFVTFNGINASEIVSWTKNQIVVKVPMGAASGKVFVTIHNLKSNELNFKVKNPVMISSILPDSAFSGEEVSISGSGFGDSKGSSLVAFPSAYASKIKLWSESLIKLLVPFGSKTGKVSVIVDSVKSNDVNFVVRRTIDSDTVKIGNQVWSIKNLDVVTYRNGDIIPEVTDPTQWMNTNTGAWCYFNNNPDNGKIYGRMYNGYAVKDPRGLAPAGWHIPSESELAELSDSCGGDNEAGLKLKEMGFEHFKGGRGGTNESGFTGLPGGYREASGTFRSIGVIGIFWSDTELQNDTNILYSRALVNAHYRFQSQPNPKSYGCYVRILKD